MNLNPCAYDDSNEISILQHAQKLVGTTIENIIQSSGKKIEINIRNKGSIGLFIEEHWFSIKPNSSPLPDFDKVGIELKIIPLIKKKNILSVKERTKICSIDYNKLVHETWDTSHAKKKLNKVLFIYYVYDKENNLKSEIKKIDLWKLQENNNEFIIKSDWLNIHEKVLDGYAHNLSESVSKVLAASRSGQGGKNKNGKLNDLVSQPNQIHEKEALKRAFSLKQSFTNQRWNELNSKIEYESIIDSLNIKEFDDFENEILNKINLYQNKSIKELSNIFNLNINNKSKNQIATIIKKAIGFKSVKSKLKEFEQLGIIVKTINTNKKNNLPFESISFPAMQLQEFETEIWDESIFKNMINKILFIPIYKKNRKSKIENKHLGKAFFWNLSENETVINREWLQYQNEVKLGCARVTKIINNSKRGYKEVSKFSKESDTLVIHMRPHGSNADDRDVDSLGNSIVKQSFWFNKKYIQKLLDRTQKNYNINGLL